MPPLAHPTIAEIIPEGTRPRIARRDGLHAALNPSDERHARTHAHEPQVPAIVQHTHGTCGLIWEDDARDNDQLTVGSVNT